MAFNSILIAAIFVLIAHASGRTISEADLLEGGREYVLPPYGLRGSMRAFIPVTPIEQRSTGGIFMRPRSEGLSRELPLATVGTTTRQLNYNDLGGNAYGVYGAGYPVNGYYPYYYSLGYGYQPYAPQAQFVV